MNQKLIDMDPSIRSQPAIAPLHFEITGPDGTRHQTTAKETPVWLGRDDDADVQLLGHSVSRRHASVEWTEEGLSIRDASSNGSVLNGVRLHRETCVVAESCASLEVGSFRIRITSASAPNQSGNDETPIPTKSAPSERCASAGVAPTPTESAPDPASSPDRLPETSRERRRAIHRQLLDHLDLHSLDRASLAAPTMRPKVVAALRRIVSGLGGEMSNNAEREALVAELADEALGLGPLERLLADDAINEIMVVDPRTIFAERRGKMELTGLSFTDDDAVRAVIERIVTPLGRRIDESTPLVDARLRDGSRVNAVIPPLALRGPCITIRKFSKTPLAMADLVRFGSLNDQMARFLQRSVMLRKNIVISGGTGSGKTTLLNVLSSAIPAEERIVTVEDAAELRLQQPHVVSLEARPPNLEGKGEYSIRDLVKNALRMRPDRIVVGECRGGEAVDMLQAMNTGHEGSLTTTHANSPKEAVARIETLCLMAGLDLPVRAIRQQIAASIHLVVQQTRLSGGARRVTSIAEVVGIDDDGEVELREIFRFKVVGSAAGGAVEGDFAATGYLPSFLDEFVARGLVSEGSVL